MPLQQINQSNISQFILEKLMIQNGSKINLYSSCILYCNKYVQYVLGNPKNFALFNIITDILYFVYKELSFLCLFIGYNNLLQNCKHVFNQHVEESIGLHTQRMSLLKERVDGFFFILDHACVNCYISS